MARIAGRNTPLTIIAGVLCALTVFALFVLAAPLLPASADWLHSMSSGLVDLVRGPATD